MPLFLLWMTFCFNALYGDAVENILAITQPPVFVMPARDDKQFNNQFILRIKPPIPKTVAMSMADYQNHLLLWYTRLFLRHRFLLFATNTSPYQEPTEEARPRDYSDEFVFDYLKKIIDSTGVSYRRVGEEAKDTTFSYVQSFLNVFAHISVLTLIAKHEDDDHRLFALNAYLNTCEQFILYAFFQDRKLTLPILRQLQEKLVKELPLSAVYITGLKHFSLIDILRELQAAATLKEQLHQLHNDFSILVKHTYETIA